jgi:hypothetical protein
VSFLEWMKVSAAHAGPGVRGEGDERDFQWFPADDFLVGTVSIAALLHVAPEVGDADRAPMTGV